MFIEKGFLNRLNIIVNGFESLKPNIENYIFWVTMTQFLS